MTKPTAEKRKHVDFNNKWSMDVITRIEIKNEQKLIFQHTLNLLVKCSNISCDNFLKIFSNKLVFLKLTK